MIDRILDWWERQQLELVRYIMRNKFKRDREKERAYHSLP